MGHGQNNGCSRATRGLLFTMKRSVRESDYLVQYLFAFLWTLGKCSVYFDRGTYSFERVTVCWMLATNTNKEFQYGKVWRAVLIDTLMMPTKEHIALLLTPLMPLHLGEFSTILLSAIRRKSDLIILNCTCIRCCVCWREELGATLNNDNIFEQERVTEGSNFC